MEKRQSLQKVVLGKLVKYVQKNETRTPSNTIHKNKLKMYERPKTINRGKQRQNPLWHKSQQDAL